MAIVFFSAGGSPWRHAVVPVQEYTRVCSAEREFGAAKLFIPRGHAILDTDAVDENGGTLIRIDHALLPSWYGIQEGPMDQGPNGWSFEATEIGILLKYNDVPSFELNGPYTAGEIIKRAFALLTDKQRGGIAPGSFVEGPPLIPTFESDGGPFAGLLTELADQSGQEWEIVEGSGGNLVLNWIAPRGQVYEPLLTEGHDLVNVHRIPDTSTLVRRVRARNTSTGAEGSVSAPELADDPLAQTVTITSDQTSVMALENVAQIHLDQHRYRSVRYRFGVRGHWTRTTVDITIPSTDTGLLWDSGEWDVGVWDGGEPEASTTTMQVFSAPAWAIRPGDYLRAVCPSAGKSGATVTLRVMKVTFGDAFSEPVFECQEIMPIDPTQLAVRTYRGQRQLAQPATVPRLLATVAS
jgi:hypothetical protein